MTDFMIYPVTAIMKFWHYVFSTLLGMDSSWSWILSLIGLIVVIRSIVAPTSWWQLKSTRKAQLLRPRFLELQREFESRTDADASKWHTEQRRAAQKEEAYNPLAGCLPILIQLPVLIGLYQVLIKMTVPKGDSNPVETGIGFLQSTDVQSFLAARFMDVPLAAYFAMSNEQVANLGTNHQDIADVATPLVIAAALFTCINMLFSIWRSYVTTDWDQGFAVAVLKFMVMMVILIPFILFISASTAPLPIAILMYWFAGNLWTMMQFFILTYMLEHKLPLTTEFERVRDEAKARYKVRRKEKKQFKRLVRKHRFLRLLQPHKFGQHSAAIKEARIARRDAKLEATAEKRKNADLRRQAEKERREQEKAAKQNDAQQQGDAEQQEQAEVTEKAESTD